MALTSIYIVNLKLTTDEGQQVILHWQYGGATNIFSAFGSLISFGFGKRITPSNRKNNELLYL